MNVTVIDPQVLTRQEARVLPWIAQGKTSWEIGQILNISERTATAHIVNIARKLKATNRAHIIAHSICKGILQVSQN